MEMVICYDEYSVHSKINYGCILFLKVKWYTCTSIFIYCDTIPQIWCEISISILWYGKNLDHAQKNCLE